MALPSRSVTLFPFLHPPWEQACSIEAPARRCLEFYQCLAIVTNWPCTSFMFSQWLRSIQGLQTSQEPIWDLRRGVIPLYSQNHDCPGYICSCDLLSWGDYCSLWGSAALADSGGTVCCEGCEVLSPLSLVMWKTLHICTSPQEHSRIRVCQIQRSMGFLQTKDDVWSKAKAMTGEGHAWAVCNF